MHAPSQERLNAGERAFIDQVVVSRTGRPGALLGVGHVEEAARARVRGVAHVGGEVGQVCVADVEHCIGFDDGQETKQNACGRFPQRVVAGWTGRTRPVHDNVPVVLHNEIRPGVTRCAAFPSCLIRGVVQHQVTVVLHDQLTGRELICGIGIPSSLRRIVETLAIIENHIPVGLQPDRVQLIEGLDNDPARPAAISRSHVLAGQTVGGGKTWAALVTGS